MKCARCGKNLTSEKYLNKFGALVGPECIKKNDILVKDETYKVEYKGLFVKLDRFPALMELRAAAIESFKQSYPDLEFYTFKFMKKTSTFWAENFEVPAEVIAKRIGDSTIEGLNAPSEYSLG